MRTVLKVYSVTESTLRNLGYHHPIDHSLRLESTDAVKVERVDSPQKAHIVILPVPIREVELTEKLLSDVIDFHKIKQEQVVAFDCSDFEASYPKTPNCIFIRCNLKGWMKRMMPRSIAWPWPVEDLGALVGPPEGGFKYDVGFQGWVWSNVRVNATQSVMGTFGPDKFDFCGYKDFYGYVERDNPKEAARRKAEFQRSLRECRVQLTPQSIHNVFPYRFFESLSAGRIPVLFCDDYCLPWPNDIPWDDITVRFGDQDSPQAGNLVKTWLNNHDDADILKRGEWARKFYERYLHRDKWNSLFTEAISELLKSEGTNV